MFDSETFRNVALLRFLLVFCANGECIKLTSRGQKVRFAMFSCTFLRIIRQSIQVLCPVFPRTVFFRIANKVWTSKTSLSVGRQDFVQHGARVISAAKQPEILHVPLVATNELLSQSPNSIFGTRFFLRETLNSLPGTNKLAFTGNMNSLLKGTKLAFLGNINSPCRIKLAFSGNIKSVRGNKLAFSGNMNFMRMETVLREIIDSELKSIAIVGSIIMVNTDNGFFDCHAEHADPDQTRLPDTDIYLSTVSYLSSDDELLIKCDENTSYLCDTLSSVNKKNCGKCENFRVRDPRSHMFIYLFIQLFSKLNVLVISSDESTLTGYVHLISQVQTSHKKTGIKYFDMALQTSQNESVRLVCYSPEKRTMLQQSQEKQLPVKITSARMSPNKRFSATDEYTISKKAKIMPTSLEFSYNSDLSNRYVSVEDALKADLYQTVVH